MDFTAYDKFVIVWDRGVTDTTLTFKDDTETITLGTVVIQSTRLRSFINSLQQVSPQIITDLEQKESSRTQFKSGKSIVEF